MTDRQRTDETDSIILECDLPEPPAKVWRALTEPDLVARWLMPGDIRPEAGHRFTLQGKSGEGGSIDCEVLAAEPERRVSYSWRGEAGERDAGGRALDTIVTFELSESEAGGTHLRLIHGGFALAFGRMTTMSIWRATPANSNLQSRMKWVA
jgi:uncharacterized protein YndB with AHSA1/START domain